MKIALALICKSSDSEAKLLDRCLENVSPYVDGIFITNTGDNKEVSKVIKKYKGVESNFEWVNDFSKARNFNFKQVPKEYEFVIWADCDDTFVGLEKLKPILEENKVDVLAFNYLYAFDEHNNPIVVHKKSQVIRNDNCVEWTGRLHEDFKENRSLNVKFVPDIQRIHNSDDEHTKESTLRNVIISAIDAKENPNDPRKNFNLGNSYWGVGEYGKAKEEYAKFLEMSQSDDEKYIVYQRLSLCEQGLGNKKEAIQNMLIAIGLMPDLPDAYNQMGYLYSHYRQLDNAEKYLLLGLVMKPKYHKMIYYNPRDYDYQPMMALAKVYFNKSLPANALPLLKGCLEINPNDSHTKVLVTEMEKEVRRMDRVLETIKRIEALNYDKEKILYEIEKLPTDLQSHPAICRIRNKYFVKEESSGKDIVYYCGQTIHEWNPEMAKTKGIGGSEEAVINLSKEWVKLGYNVTVYNSCGNFPMTCDGVEYKPFWFYNPKDKTDITILWRSPALADYGINSDKIYVDLHDVIKEGEFTENRLKNIDKIFVKTKFHRSLFPNVPDKKFAIIENGLSMEGEEEVEKDPYLIINTSSPDRSMGITPKLFKEIKKQVPEAKMAWAYGFEIFNNAHSSNKMMMEWRDKTISDMNEAGIENLGRLSQKEVAKLYQKASIFFYPTHFAEIHCISVCKAQMAKCFPVTTDFAALGETNRFGFKTHSNKTKDDWSKPYQLHFGVDDESEQKQLIDAVVNQLKNPKKIEGKEYENWKKNIVWSSISKKWDSQFQ